MKSSDIGLNTSTQNIEEYFGKKFIWSIDSSSTSADSFASLQGSLLTYCKALQYILSVIPPEVFTPWKSSPVFVDQEISSKTEDNESESDSHMLVRHRMLFPHPRSRTSPVTYIDHWMLQWHLLALYRPSLVQIMLYRLGYVEREHDKGVISRPKRLPHFP